MANEIQIPAISGLTQYATLWAGDIQTIRKVAGGFESPGTSAWSTYVIALTANGYGLQSGDMPSAVAAGTYRLVTYLQAGASPAITDLADAPVPVYWDGANLVGLQTINAKTANLPASPAAVGSDMGTVTSVTGDVGGNVVGNVGGSVASVTAGVTLATEEHANIADDTQAGLTAQGLTTARAGYLDTLNGLVATTVTAVWAALTGALTTAGSIGAFLIAKLNVGTISVAPIVASTDSYTFWQSDTGPSTITYALLDEVGDVVDLTDKTVKILQWPLGIESYVTETSVDPVGSASQGIVPLGASVIKTVPGLFHVAYRVTTTAGGEVNTYPYGSAIPVEIVANPGG